MPWGVAAAAVAAAGTAYAANKSSSAASSAASTSQAAQDLAYSRTYENLSQYLQSGQTALTQLNALASGDYSAFLTSPEYLATQESGLQALDRSAAARGALNSGGADADRIAYGASLGAQQLSNYQNSLYSLANMGQSAANTLAGVNTNYANSTGSIASTNAASQSASDSATAGAATSLINSLISQYGGTTGNTNSSSYTPTTSSSAGSLYNFGNNTNWYSGGGW